MKATRYPDGRIEYDGTPDELRTVLGAAPVQHKPECAWLRWLTSTRAAWTIEQEVAPACDCGAQPLMGVIGQSLFMRGDDAIDLYLANRLPERLHILTCC